MVLLDTNIIIYLAVDDRAYDKLRSAVSQQSNFHFSVISKIETLGYHKLTVGEEITLSGIISRLISQPVTNQIVECAIDLRKRRSMSLGDSCIAATAIVCNLELWTNNTQDFAGIEGLKLHNPLR